MESKIIVEGNVDMLLIDSYEELTKLIENLSNNVAIYGAGTVARKFALHIKKYYGNLDKVRTFYVSYTNQSTQLFGKPVIQYDNCTVDDEEKIIVAIGGNARADVINKLEGHKGEIFAIDRAVLKGYGNEELYYRDCIEEVSAFLEQSNYSVKGVEKRAQNYEGKLYAWTCWWQGEEEAPDLVKACINSQRKNLPNEVEYIVITEKNCKDFVDFPNSIIKKVEDGSITLTTFSDMLREKLIYEYGGIWFDATVLIHKPFPKEYFRMPLYTCKGKEYHFESYSQWSLWCMGGVKGNDFYKFLFDLFNEYYKYNDKIKYYLTVDYFIKAAMIYVDGVSDLYKNIPINNENADKLAICLKEDYSIQLYNELIQNTYLSKLTTKHFDGRNGANFKGFSDTSIYAHILETYL